MRRRSTAQATRKWRLTTQVLDIGASILDDALPDDITLFELAVDPAAVWEKQWERMTMSTTRQFSSQPRPPS